MAKRKPTRPQSPSRRETAKRAERRPDEHASKSAWLRAAVLGANDGILSTAGLLVGVAAARAAPAQVLVTGVAGLTAGALSMASGEYVSVSSQVDVERSRLTTSSDPEHARSQHAELSRRPLVAAAASAAAYGAGAALPLLTAVLTSGPRAPIAISAASLVSLATLGAVAAYVGGAKPLLGAVRVTFWGALAMAITGIVGHVFGAGG